jgi:GNAT superfamily N-acetyltransferase
MYIRKMSKPDIDFAVDLTSAEGWGSIKLDFEELLEFDPEGCFIAEISDTPIGMICATPYNGFGFVSNLIVLEDYRNRKFGTLLMKHALEYLENRGVISHLLDGVLKAISLYERFSFEKRYKSLRLEGFVEPKESDNIRLMTSADLNTIDQFDIAFFGASRRSFLQSRLKHFPRLCKVLEIEGDVAGYIMGSKRYDFIRIGPWVMKTNLEHAEDLLCEFALETEELPLQIGLLENNENALHLLQKYEFLQRSFSWRMMRGFKGDWTFSDHLYAICSAARG